MADLSQYLNGGGKRLKTVTIDEAVISSGATGTLLTITPTAEQYVYFAVASGDTNTTASIAIGGSTVYTGSFQRADLDTGQVYMGGKGEAVVLSRTQAGTNPTDVLYQLLEEA